MYRVTWRLEMNGSSGGNSAVYQTYDQAMHQVEQMKARRDCVSLVMEDKNGQVTVFI